MGTTTEPPAPAPAPGQIVIDKRLAWGLVSAIALAVGSVGTWVSAGPFAVAGTTGGGDGWITLAIGVVAGLLVAFRRFAWLALPGAIVAAGVGIGAIVRFLDIDGGEWFSVSIGWGLVLVVLASLSLAVWGAMALSSAPRVPAGVLTVLALAGAIALGVTDRDDDSTEQARPTLLDAADESSSADNAEPADWDTEADPGPTADADPTPPTTEQDPAPTTKKSDAKVQRAGSIAWEFRGFKQVDRVGSREAQDGERLLLGRVRWTNHGTSPVSTLCIGPSARLIGTNEEQWDPNTEVMLNLPGNVCDDLGPGLSRTDGVLFVVPRDAGLDSIAFWDPTAEDPQQTIVQFRVAGR